MIKMEHLHLLNHEHRVLVEDASFCLPNRGIISIGADQEELHHGLAQVLSGILKPTRGSIIYNDCVMSTFDEEERSVYRSTFVTSLYHDFQILKDKTIYQNVTMELEYPSERVEEVLRTWKLYDKQDVLAEDVSTQDQWRMVLVRCVLRQAMMLVVDVESSSLSPLERIDFYPLLEELRTHMLVVVIGDMRSYSISNRVIEFQQGYIVSDSLTAQESFPQINQAMEAFQLTRSNMETMQEKIHTHIRWKLRCASVLCVVGFICLSTAIFSTTLDITDIQMRLMEKQNSSMIAIQKMAEEKEGSIMNTYYDTLHERDITTLQEDLQQPLVIGYSPIDLQEASYYSYGTSILDDNRIHMNDYTIMEADSNEELGFKSMYGRYPSNYHEVALSSQQAYALLKEELNEPYRNNDEQIEMMLQQRVEWYGNEFIISAIFPSNNKNINMELDMTGYNGDVTQNGSMMEKSFFVKKGFVNKYQVLQENTYQKSYKRMISKSRVIADFEHISTLDQDVYYYNGKDVVMEHDIKEGEVLLDFPMALDMGYRSSYVYGVDEEHLVDFEQRIENYKAFADQWIGKTITIQTYTTLNSPNASSIMSEKVKIKGFMIPITYHYLDRYANNEQQGCAYFNKASIHSYMSKNMYIKEAFYQSDDRNKLQDTLSYLNKQPSYAAYLTNSTILQFFVVDLKNMNMLLVILGTVSFALFVAILTFLLRSSVGVLRSELSTYYIFGERKSILSKLIKQYFQTLLWMRSLFGWFCGTLALTTFIVMIYFTLSASLSILWTLCLPVLLLCIIVFIMKVSFALSLKHMSIIEEEFREE